MRRPLAAAALVFVFLVRLITWIRPLPVPIPEYEDGQTAEYTGDVSDIIQYTDQNGQSVRIVVIQNAVSTDRTGGDAHSQNVSDETHLTFNISDTSLKNSDTAKNSQFCEYKILCRLQEDEMLPEIGSRVRFRGKVSWFSQATNPGEFDSRDHYNRQGYVFWLKQAELTGKSKEYDRAAQLLYRVKSRLGEALDTCLQEKEASVVKAMLLGEKKGMDQEVKELYQRAGISHILAISGLHISLLGMGVYRILSGFCGRKASGVIASLFLLAYLCMTGFSASSLRAGIMFIMSMTARMIGRTYDAPTALAVAAALLLAENPAWIGDSGFQLSFLAAVGAVAVIPRFSSMQDTGDWLLHHRRWSGGAGKLFKEAAHTQGHFSSVKKGTCRTGSGLKYISNELQKGFLSSFCISMVTLPVVLKSFYEWNALSLMINILVIPLMGVLLGCCIVLAVTGAAVLSFAPGMYPLLSFIAFPVRAILYLYEKLCMIGNSLPFGMLRTGEPRIWQIILYGVGFGAVLLAARKMPRIAGILSVSLLSLIFWIQPMNRVQMTMLDVGQGECIYLETEQGHDYLYDGGSTSKSSTGQWQIIPFLKQQGVRRLELIFVSHWDEDHINGIQEVLEWAGEGNLQIGGMVLSAAGPEDEMLENLLNTAQAAQVPVFRMAAGEKIVDGECEFLALYPADYQADRNNSSLVLRFSRQQNGEEVFSALLTGDVEEAGECEVLRDWYTASENAGELHGRSHRITVLDVAHHGSKTSTCEAFLDEVSPQIALISCGKDNAYGHPDEEILQRLEERNIPVFVTAQTGAVTVCQNGEKVIVRH